MVDSLTDCTGFIQRFLILILWIRIPDNTPADLVVELAIFEVQAANRDVELGIAIAAAVAGSFSMTRKQLSNSIAGVAIAVALVPPLCVSGIGLTLGSEMEAVFGRGTVAGLTNQIAEGSFLLFLANLIGISVTSLVVFLVQRYGSICSC